MTRLPKSIVIAGGGTAGWLAALILKDALRSEGTPLDVTLIESIRIGTIGVGEGTTAVFRMILQKLGFDEAEFLRETGATIKYGIRHKDWRRIGHHYDGPIDDPAAIVAGIDLYAVASGRSVAEAHLFQQLMKQKKVPWALNGDRLVAAGPFHHAYHFDQARAGTYLKSKASGVTLLDDQIRSVRKNGEGVKALKLESGRELTADFFIDCTGFRRVLIGELGASWMSYADVLPVNRAMPFWIDIAEGEEIDPLTLAFAQKNGWMWKIPTQDRYGCGYVYSDLHVSPEEAKAEIETALGHDIEPRNDIRIDAGRLDQSWIGNCCALGLASSFLEPLEATSIHGTIVQLLMLANWLGDPDGRAKFNSAAATQVDDFRDFIRTHYISERRDSAFWQDVAESHPKPVTDRISHWRAQLPKRGDFQAFPGDLPHVQEQLYTPVLDGLGLLDRGSAKAVLAEDPKRRARLRKAHEQLKKEYRQAASKCLPHRSYLQSLREAKAA
ncbi:MAG: tryptophan halogenase family protein [Pseudomonadota bacterium]